MGDDNLEQYPVHKQDATRWPIFGNHWDPIGSPNAEPNNSMASFQLPESLIYSDSSIYQFGTNGPYNQTLFLGCSVVNFNVNLGWGGDDSTCTVSLVEDDAYHWNNPTLRNNNDNNIINENTQHSTIQNTITNNPTNPTFKTSPYTDPLDSTYNLPGSTGTVKDFLPPYTSRKDQYRNILNKEEDRKKNLQKENTFLSIATPANPDLGKVYYEILDNGILQKKYWTYPDPGFVGETYDILGCAVRFKFHEFEFAGIVASWKKDGSQGGKKYTVELKSFSSLLSNTQLITEYYHGSLFKKVKGEDGLNDSNNSEPTPYSEPTNLSSNSTLNISGIGFPSNDLGKIYGPELDKQNDNYIGNIVDGACANVFNLYGYYENYRGFGRNDVNELGMKARDILNGIELLVNQMPTGNTPDELEDARFSQYGTIVCRAPALTKDFALQPLDGEDDPNNSGGNIDAPNYRFLKDQYSIQPSGAIFYSLVEYITSPLNNPNIKKEQQLLTLGQKGTALHGESWPDLKLNEMGIIPVRQDKNGFYKQFFRVNLTGIYDPSLNNDSESSQIKKGNPGAVPYPPEWYRVKGPVISIMDFVQNLCSNAGHDFFIDYLPPHDIWIRSVSRKVQPTTNYIQQLLTVASESQSITSFNFGKEFNKDAIPKTLYIGAKQQRLLQLNSSYLSNLNTSVIHDPFAKDGEGLFVFHNLDESLNIAKIPNHLSLRNSYYSYYYDELFNINPDNTNATGAMVWEYNWPDRSNWTDDDDVTGAGIGNYYYPIVYKGGNLKATNKRQRPADVLDKTDDGDGDLITDIFTDLAVNMFGPSYQNLHTYLIENKKIENNPIVSESFADRERSQLKKDPNVFYNYPLWDEFICPYFGLDIDGTARKVYFDPAMNQIQVVCSIGDLTNILGFSLTKSLDIETIIPETSQTSNPSEQNSDNQSSIPYNPNDRPTNLGEVRQQVRDIIPDQDQRVTTWNTSKRGYYTYSSKFLITENEIRAAMGSLDSWLEYTFNRNFTTDLGQILRKTIFGNTGKIVQENASNVDGIEKLANNGQDLPVTVVANGPDLIIRGSVQADNPSGSKAAIANEQLKQIVDKVYRFVADLGNTYYGRQFMVKVPGLTIGQDIPYTTGSAFEITLPNTGIKIGEYKGGGKKYASYKPATDGAWEEPGNIIDDTMIVGSTEFELFRNDDGKIGAILGYRASYEYLPPTGSADVIREAIGPEGSTPGEGSSEASFTKVDGTTEATYTSIKGNNQYSQKYWRDIIRDILTNSNTPTSPPTTISQAPSSKAIAIAEATSVEASTKVTPGGWNPSLITELSKEQYLFVDYKNDPDQYIASDKIADSFSREDNDYTNPTKTIFGYDSGGTDNRRDIPVDDLTSTSSPPQGSITTPPIKKGLRYKLYVKANIDSNLVFIRNPINKKLTVEDIFSDLNVSSYNVSHKEPRAILTIDSPVIVNPVRLNDKYLYHALTIDSQYFSYRGASIPNELNGLKNIAYNPNQKKNTEENSSEPTTILDGTVNNGYVPYTGGFALGQEIIGLATESIINSLNSSAYKSIEDKSKSMPIAPKAAMPGFAAVPLINEGSVYGPWTNHPSLIPKDIFTDTDLYFGQGNSSSLVHSIENLIGGVKVVIDTNLAPWNFGGMQNLDINVISTIQEDANYQLTIEQGSVEIPGAPIYKLGDFLDRSSSVLGGPIINSISANIDTGAVNTTYSFRTFNKKFGLYNKENADRLAKISQEGISRRKQIALDIARVQNDIISRLTEKNLNEAPTEKFVPAPMVDEWRSSTDLFYGFNDIEIRVPEGLPPATGSKDVLEKFKYDLKWGFDPVKTIDVMSGIYNIVDYPKYISNTFLSDSRESSQKVMDRYDETSFMSLDGLLSPISFYPTQNFRTYHITKYPRSLCRFCQSTGKIKYKTNRNNIEGNIPKKLEDSNQRKQQDDKEEIIENCPFCEPDIDKAKLMLKGTRRGTSDPPFIYTTGEYTLTTGVGTKLSIAGSVINYSTLNPAVLSFGEFSNFQNRQSGDFTGHSIKTIGQSIIPPYRPTDSLNQAGCNANRLFKSFMDYDQLYLDMCKTVYDAGQEPGFSGTMVSSFSSEVEFPHRFANNARFFGLRGPLMLHSWGYDTEGYPVPNASGEHKIKKTEGAPPQWDYYIVQEAGISITGYVYKNQEFIETTDIPPGKQKVLYDSKIGYFTDPKKETEFAIGWAQTPTIWPVGPIDLRWDKEARVWTVPTKYKNAYILLEEDLARGKIARGELIDNNQSIENINYPLSYRKVVYVKDNIGVYGAPRSSIIYCAYDLDGGFYEPISQSVFTTSGTVISDNSVELYKIYRKEISSLNNSSSSSADEDLTYISNFSNPLDLNIDIGDMGFFTYMGDGWVLQSSRG